MKIISISLAKLTIPLIRPFITAVRRTDSVNDIVVMIKTDKGNIGYGSAAATPAITGDSEESIIKAIQEHIAPKLIGHRIDEFNHLLHLIKTALPGNTSPKAAIDIALHDLFAQHCQMPLYKLLGGHKNTLATSMTISVKNTDEMVADALALIHEGFHTLKIKLGLDPIEDLTRVRAIRSAVGNKIKLLVDANQGWDVNNALNIIHAFEQEKLNIDLIEQPVKASDLKGLKAITDQVSSVIFADESCFSPVDALNITQNHISDGINIKLMKSGGIANAQAMYHIAHTANLNIMVGCMLESPIGVAAAASFALSRENISLVDLDPIALIRENYVKGGAQLINNHIVLSDKPGLGIEGFSQGVSIVN
jgi:L-alanine-DL-glutamate epimerase-like enolase superfamily enzyme